MLLASNLLSTEQQRDNLHGEILSGTSTLVLTVLYSPESFSSLGPFRHTRLIPHDRKRRVIQDGSATRQVLGLMYDDVNEARSPHTEAHIRPIGGHRMLKFPHPKDWIISCIQVVQGSCLHRLQMSVGRTELENAMFQLRLCWSASIMVYMP